MPRSKDSYLRVALRRLEMNVIIVGECHVWSGKCFPSGYGMFAITIDGKHEQRAHRTAWTLRHGKIPDGMCILHRCDNPPCIRDDHHFLGTNRDNTQDMISKGRKPLLLGEHSSNWKLSDDEVAKIRSMYAAGGTSHRLVGLKFGVSREHVRDLCNLRYRPPGRR